jgi:integrase/recombinase XerD
MNERTRLPAFSSALAPWIEEFIAEKQACGYKYITEAEALRRLDRFLRDQGLETAALPRQLVERWIAKDPNESPRTQRTRIGLVRRLATFLLRHGCPAYVPGARLTAREPSPFVPYIFSHDEIRRLLEAADALPVDPRSPLRHRVLPAIFRVLYGCGLRLGEAVDLRVGEVDLLAGVLVVRQGKFRKDRLVPLTPALGGYLRRYAASLGDRPPEAPFFPAPHAVSYHHQTIYHAFRQLLWRCRIPHGGRGRGPRLHDLRHTFAVHRLARWYREGADLNALLPVLATYLGHHSVTETQLYLRLTAELFPDLSARAEAAFGRVIPRRTVP